MRVKGNRGKGKVADRAVNFVSLDDIRAGRKESELQLAEFAVGFKNLVAHCRRKIDGKARLLHGDHQFMHVLSLAGSKRGDHLRLLRLQIVDCIQRIVKGIRKAGGGKLFGKGGFFLLLTKIGLGLLEVGNGVAVCLNGGGGNAHDKYSLDVLNYAYGKILGLIGCGTYRSV